MTRSFSSAQSASQVASPCPRPCLELQVSPRRGIGKLALVSVPCSTSRRFLQVYFGACAGINYVALPRPSRVHGILLELQQT